MKNLILPFTFIALLVGSCTEDSTVNSQLSENLVISEINTVKIQFENLPAIFGTSTYDSGSIMGGGGRSTSDSSQGILNFSEIVTHKSSREVDSIIASKPADTIQIIGLFKQEKTSVQINQYARTSSSHDQMQRVNLVIDTITNRVNYLFFERYNNSRSGQYSGSMSSTEYGNFNSASFILKDVEYTRFKDFLVIEIKASDISAKLLKFSQGSSTHTSYNEPGHGTDRSESSGSGFRSFLPFTDESTIRIVLKKQ